jgi:uncharacterized membrane protein
MRFATPLALLLLLTLPAFYWVGRPGPRGPGRWRDWTSIALRLLIVSLITLALAGAQTVRAADELAVVFLVDASDSITPAQAETAEAYVRQAVEGLRGDDKAAVVLFGANALVERPMSALAELAPFTSRPQTLATDMADAVRLGLALFPTGAARRLVLLSDGAATEADPLAAARLAAAAEVRLDVVPLARPTAVTEALVTGVEAPAQIQQGEMFNVVVSIESTDDMPATLRILAGRELVFERQVQLRSGVSNFPITLQASEQAFARYTVQLAPAADTAYQNNELATFTNVIGPPRVLLVAPTAELNDAGGLAVDDAAALQQALASTGLNVTRVTPRALSDSLDALNDYASLVLVNVNASDLTPRKMAALQTFVQELGGGLVAVGGPESYGVGGYYRTPLEATLPVDMQIKDQERFPAVGIVIVIDRSGSMSAPEGGLTKIQLASEGAVRVVELLNDFDEIAVIPVDTQPDGPIGPVSAGDKAALIGEIRQIGAGGGGIYVRAGLEAAAAALAEMANPIQHVIVLADGADSEQKDGVPALLDELTAGDVTISFVSIGDGPDVAWLEEMAEQGNGRFHFTDQAANLPQIFTQETTSIQRSYLVEEPFFPNLAPGAGNRRAILSGIAEVPQLLGYVGTSPKETAQVVLETHLGDPLLATWQSGLGRAVAWTSDATGRWATDWVRWPGFATFWSQVVRWTIVQDRDSSVEAIVAHDGERATLTVDVRAADGGFLNDLALTANVVAPDGAARTVSLAQVAPGRYEGAFAPEVSGAYFIRVTGEGAGEQAGEQAIAQTTGWVLGYSPEYRLTEVDPARLAALAALTGGQDISADPTAALAHDLPGVATVRPIWQWLLLAAVVLLPADIAVRRLSLTRLDLARAWNRLVRPERSEAAPAQTRSAQVSQLFEAKRRAGTQAAAEDSSRPASPKPATMKPGPASAADNTGEAAPTEAEQGEGTLAARLLARRRHEEQDEPVAGARPTDDA